MISLYIAMTYQKTSQKNLRKTSKKLKFLEVPFNIVSISIYANGVINKAFENMQSTCVAALPKALGEAHLLPPMR